MNPYIEKLKQHIADSSPDFDDADSVLSLLYECYNENHPYDNEEIKADFNALYAVLVNYSDEVQDAGLVWKDTVSAPEPVYGDAARIAPFDAAILKW